MDMKLLDWFSRSKTDAKKKASLGRNEHCWCGSGKKHKRCHLDRDAYKRRMNGDIDKAKI